MGIKEKLGQILAERARQEAEGARRANKAREAERVRLQTEEARKNAEMQRVKGILDSKGITQMLEGDVLPLLREMGAVATLGSVTEKDIVVDQKGQQESIQAMGVAISGDGPKRSFNDEYNYDNAQLGVFIETVE